MSRKTSRRKESVMGWGERQNEGGRERSDRKGKHRQRETIMGSAT